MVAPLDLFLTFVAGLLSSLTPCILPLLTIIVGGATIRTKHYVLFMALGVVVSYAVIGTITGFVDPLFGISQDHFVLVAGWSFIVVSILVAFPSLLVPLQVRMQSGLGAIQLRTMNLSVNSNGSAFLLGALLALGWSPCAGPMLGSALLIVSTEPGAVRGGVLLAVYGAGATLPLVLIGYLARARIDRFLQQVRSKEKVMRWAFAVTLGALGLALVSGIARQIEGQLLQAISLEILALLYQL